MTICDYIFRPYVRTEFVNPGRRQEVHQRDGERTVGDRPQADCHVGLGFKGGRNSLAHHHGGKQGTNRTKANINLMNAVDKSFHPFVLQVPVGSKNF
jgi:hypothetical protein